MRSSDRSLLLLLGLVLVTSEARAEPPAQGFAVDRLYQSAPGAGWVVMDTLDMHGDLGGTVAISTGYANNPLRVSQGAHGLQVVSDEAFTDFGFALGYRRFRLSMNLTAPLSVKGDSGNAGGFAYVAPSTSLANDPDTIEDVRFGLDARVLGEPGSPFRLGLGAQLYVPSGTPDEYVSDGTYRAMLRVMAAGDYRSLTYAAHLGVHIRPRDDGDVPGSPQGSELLFGLAAGSRAPLGKSGLLLVAGPEVYGETALRAFFGGTTTGVEGMLSARVETTNEERLGLRVKLGAGGGLDTQFGTPEWRAVAAVELFGHVMPTAK